MSDEQGATCLEFEGKKGWVIRKKGSLGICLHASKVLVSDRLIEETHI